MAGAQGTARRRCVGAATIATRGSSRGGVAAGAALPPRPVRLPLAADAARRPLSRRHLSPGPASTAGPFPVLGAEPRQPVTAGGVTAVEVTANTSGAPIKRQGQASRRSIGRNRCSAIITAPAIKK